MICESDSNDIINQYIIFSKVYGEQRKKYGRTREAIQETIRICKDRNILKEYLESREKEVVDIMLALFDEQEVYETHFKSVAKEFEAKGEIKNTIDNFREFGQSKENTIKRLIEKFGLTSDDATARVNAAWK